MQDNAPQRDELRALAAAAFDDPQQLQGVQVRVDGAAIPLESPYLCRAFPEAGERIAVFLHGLMCTELDWAWRAHYEGGTYGTRLEAELGFTPIYLRYAADREVSESARAVAGLLEQLLSIWPCGVRELVLIGHSLGGLVARGACHHGAHSGQQWAGRVSHVVSLGTPCLPTVREPDPRVVATALRATPERRARPAFVRRRPAPVRELRRGSLVDEDWRGRDCETLRAAAIAEGPLPARATHCFVSAAVVAGPDHRAAGLLGDMLLLGPAASPHGATRRIRFREGDDEHIGSAPRLALLNHPLVCEHLCGWLREEG